MRRILASDRLASSLRMCVRAVLISVTAFGLQLDANQVAAIQLLTEAFLQLARAWHERSE